MSGRRARSPPSRAGSTWPWCRCRPASSGGVVIDAAHKGAHAMVVLTGTDSPIEAARTVVNLARAYGIRALGPDALGVINTDRAASLNATPGTDAARRRRRAVLPVGGGRDRAAQLRDPARHRDVERDQQRGVRRHHRQRRDAVLGGRQRDPGLPAGPGLDRQPAQVLPDRPSARLGASRWSCSTRAERTGPPTSARGVVWATPRTRRSTRLFRQSGVMVVHRRGAMFDIAKIASRQPLPRGPPGPADHQLRDAGAADDAHDPPASGLLLDGDAVLLDPAATAAEFDAAARDAMADDALRLGAVCRGQCLLRWNRRDPCGAVVGGRPRPRTRRSSASCWTSHPSASRLRRARCDGFVADVRRRCRCRARAVRAEAYAHWRERDPGAVPLLEVDEVAARRLVNSWLGAVPDGRTLDPEETAELLGTYGIKARAELPVVSRAEAVRTPPEARLECRAEGDLAGRPRAARPGQRAPQPRRCEAELGAGLGRSRPAGRPARTRLRRGRSRPRRPSCRRWPLPASRWWSISREDAAFGPIVSVGLDGIATELLGDAAYRVPPLTTADGAGMVRDLRGRPGAVRAARRPRRRRQRGRGCPAPAVAAGRRPSAAGARSPCGPCVASVNGIAVLGGTVTIAPTAAQRDPLARGL